MVDVIIGSIQPLGPPIPRPIAGGGGAIEAEILNVRPPRKGIAGPDGRERRKNSRRDPASGRVITLLVPNGTDIPKDLDGRRYKAMLRLVKK
ncbi:MAG: hypothetical protein BWK76_12990 [Desulfobulbaceae bacterium A2]|nr:MAG: hypothetical protein BWK76_12990 [Desulfobulbaceae bacterium A2]